MKRLGLYSGRIYTQEDVDNYRIRECCLVLRDVEAENEQYVTEQYIKRHVDCSGCSGCPESRLGIRSREV